jgi:hypothetical protein
MLGSIVHLFFLVRWENLPRTIFLTSFYEDVMSPFLLRLSWHYLVDSFVPQLSLHWIIFIRRFPLCLETPRRSLMVYRQPLFCYLKISCFSLCFEALRRRIFVDSLWSLWVYCRSPMRASAGLFCPVNSSMTPFKFLLISVKNLRERPLPDSR